MGLMTNGWQWIRSIARQRSLERGFDEEMRFHIDQQTEKNVRAGMTPVEARRQAFIRFGGVERSKEDARDEIRPALLDDSMRDVRHGIRVLRRAPGFTASALVTLALGIGATSAIFSVVRTVMLQPLPYRDPGRLVSVWETNRGGTARNSIAPANFVEWRARTRTLDHLGMVGQAGLAMMVNGEAAQVNGFFASYSVFDALGVQPALGRAYTMKEDLGGNDGVIVLGHEFWQRRLAGRADVLGLTIATNGRPRTVIGVMPPAFTLIGDSFGFLIPYGQSPEQLAAVRGRGSSIAIGRLHEGVTRDQAFAEMRAIYADLEREVPQRNARRTVMMFGLQEQMVGDLRPALFALVGAVGLVLLVACVNVANLLLARSAAREREIGMRTALGARRGRLVRQMLVESLTLAAAGGLAGLGVAVLFHRGLLAFVASRINIPRFDQIALDLPVVAFTMTVAVACGALFGVVPALVSTSHVSESMREGGRHGSGRRVHRVLRSLVVAEVALSIVLLACAGLLLRSFLKLQSVNPGFQSDGIFLARVQLPATRYDAAQSARFFQEARARLAALPGVQRVAGATCAPLPGSCIGTSFWRVDLPKPPDGQLTSGHIRPITPAFFRTLEIPHLLGRDFAESDTADAPPVAIVSEALVREQFGGSDPIGRRLRINIDHVNGRADVEWTIVGVVGNIRSSLDGPLRQTIYVPTSQQAGTVMRLFVKTDRDPLLIASSLTGTIRAMEAEAPIDAGTLDETIGNSIALPRVTSLLVSVFAIVALVLAAVGVYGVMAYSVRERTREIGVRMALGASAGSVFRLVIGQALRLVCIGVVTGLVAAAGLTRLLERLLYGVQPLDPWTFALTAAVLLGVAALAAYLPARRGMRMAPVDALRL